MRVRLWTALAVSIPLGVITTFLMGIALQARRNKVTTGSEGLVGGIAVVRSPLTPEGKVFINGELWNAVSTVPAEIGQHVRVRRVRDLRLEVEPLNAPARQSQLPVS
jgi:membrane-bound serine protease (ClpP class)